MTLSKQNQQGEEYKDVEKVYKRYKVLIKKNGVAHVVLNCPERMNRMDYPHFFHETREIFEDLDNNESVLVIVVYAEGKMFSAGLDLKSAMSLFGNTDQDASHATSSVSLMKKILELQDCFTRIEQCKKPVLACVHGHCIGGAIDMITCADMRFCTQDAIFSVRETKLAIVADLGTLQRMGRVMKSKGQVREMIYTGDDYSAEKVWDFGLVNRVFKTKQEMLSFVLNLADRIASNSPLVVQGAKKVLQFAEEHSVEDGLYQVALWNTAFLNSDDLQEAFMSFLQKRTPLFKNKL